MVWRKFFLSGSALLLAVPVVAHADDIFTLTNGADTVSFSLPASPSNPQTSCGRSPGFCFNSVSLEVNGGSQTGNIVFYPGGGLSVSGNYINYYLVYGGGPVLFTGSDSAPTFDLGTFSIYSGGLAVPPEFLGPLTLTIAPAAAPTPEPSSLWLLGSAILGMSMLFGRGIARHGWAPPADRPGQRT